MGVTNGTTPPTLTSRATNVTCHVRMPTSLIERYRCWRRCIPASVYIRRPCVCVLVSLPLFVFAHSAHGALIRNEQLFCCPYVDRIRSTIVARASLSRIASDDITRTLIYEIYTRGAEFKGDQRNVFFHARQTKVTDESGF